VDPAVEKPVANGVGQGEVEVVPGGHLGELRLRAEELVEDVLPERFGGILLARQAGGDMAADRAFRPGHEFPPWSSDSLGATALFLPERPCRCKQNPSEVSPQTEEEEETAKHAKYAKLKEFMPVLSRYFAYFAVLFSF
jgi:hypothetical protein